MIKGRGMVRAVLVVLLSMAQNLTSSHAEAGMGHVTFVSHGKDRLVQQTPRLAQGRAVAESTQTSGIIIGSPPGGEETSIDRDPDGDRQVELAFWSSIRDSSDPADFEAYLETFPDGAFVLLARNRLAALAAGTGQVESGADPDKALTQTDRMELTRMLQTALLHAGCSPGRPDGQWGPRSRRALERFNRHAGTSFQLDAATAEALEDVRSRSDVCPAVAQQPRRPTATAARRAPAPAAQRAPAQPRTEPRRRNCALAWEQLNSPYRQRIHPERRC